MNSCKVDQGFSEIKILCVMSSNHASFVILVGVPYIYYMFFIKLKISAIRNLIFPMSKTPDLSPEGVGKSLESVS